MKPLSAMLALLVALAATGVAVVFTQSQSPAVLLACPTSPARSRPALCPPLGRLPGDERSGAERLMNAAALHRRF